MKKILLMFAVMAMGLPVLAVPIQQCASFLTNANHCSRYEGNAKAMRAIGIIAGNLQYSMEEICNHERILDIFIDKRNLVRPEKDNKIEPHVWVTLHYNEYSCQYFISEDFWVVTRKNCYNTW